MVDQNANAQQTSSSKNAESTHEAQKGGGTDPTVAKAGEYMLIFALLLIFCVCLAVAIHLYLRRQKRHRRKQPKKKKKEKKTLSLQPELQNQEHKIAELVGTPLCEMGESEPRHEMEDAEVHERYTTIDLEDPRDNPVLTPTGSERDLEAGTMFGEMTTHSIAGPGAAAYAVYLSR